MTIEQLQEQLKEAQKQSNFSNYAKAEEIIQEVLQWCDELRKQGENIDLDRISAKGNYIISNVFWQRGENSHALRFAEFSKFFSEKTKTIEDIVRYKLLFAIIYYNMSDYQIALDYLNDAEAIAIKFNKEIELVGIKNTKGIIYLEYLSAELAINFFLEALDKAKSLGMDDFIINAIGNLGNCYKILGQYDKALESYQYVICLCESSNFIIIQANSLNNIGIIYLAQGQYILSLENLYKALTISKSIKATSLTGSIYTNIGSCYRGIGNYQKSIIYYFKSLKILEKCETKEKIAVVLGNIAILYRFLENFNAAEKFFLESLQIFETIKDDGSVGAFWGNYAHMLYEQKRYLEAKEKLEKTITAFQINTQIIEENQYNYYLCKIHINNNEFDKAKEIAFRRYQVFCEHNRKDEIPSALELIGDLYANPAFDEYNVELAEQYYLQAIDKFVEIGSKHGIYHFHQYIAQFYKQNNRWEEYAANIEKSMELYKKVQNDEVKKQADRFGWERKIAEMEKEKEIEKVRNEAEKKLLEQQVASQKREVETTIHELVNKNSLLHEVRKDVQALSKYTIREGQDVVERLLDRLERNIVPLESKSDLEKQWTEVHAPFMELMKQRYPALTTMELKICALLKMKLTSSNICSILFLSKRTVEFHRLNIRKKMGLSKSDDIHVILNSLL